MARVQEPGLDWASRKLDQGTQLSSPIATDTQTKEDAVEEVAEAEAEAEESRE